MIGRGDCLRDVSLYFHIPFCSKKCPYCHFFVLPNDDKLKEPFLASLLKEWEMRTGQLLNRRIVSIYFGGGTPTKLNPSHYFLLLDAIRTSGIEIASDCEITLEANPEDVSFERMQEFASLGINRVSLGVQSLTEGELFLLGRSHTTHRSLSAIQEVYQAGIHNISIDLMFELPHQTLTSWLKSLHALADLPLTHLSLYNLTFEPQTVFYKKQKELLPQLPPDEERLKMLEVAVETFGALGLKRYEISAFAKPGMHSRHNTGYWTGREFLGFGPSAFSYWEGSRFSNVAHFSKYLDAIGQSRFPIDFEEKLDPMRSQKELLAIALRLVDGVDLKAFRERYGAFSSSLEQSLERIVKKGWLYRDEWNLKLTGSGQLFYDTVASEII